MSGVVKQKGMDGRHGRGTVKQADRSKAGRQGKKAQWREGRGDEWREGEREGSLVSGQGAMSPEIRRRHTRRNEGDVE